MLRPILRHAFAKPIIFTLCSLPFFYLVWGALNDGLGANTAEYLIRATGDWTLRFLCITLAVTPL
ncbi:MAG: sulfoxide reductase heme-binding subunit YedZ, partial [Betaproteobacteria bacterium]